MRKIHISPEQSLLELHAMPLLSWSCSPTGTELSGAEILTLAFGLKPSYFHPGLQKKTERVLRIVYFFFFILCVSLLTV